MAISQKELTKKKNMVKLLMEATGENFDDWLAKKYDEAFHEREEVLHQALKGLATNNNRNQHRN